MAVPSSNLGDLLVADRAESFLLFPEREQPAFSFERCLHANIETFLKVAFPLKIIRVRFSPNFDVSSDRHGIRSGKMPGLLTLRSEEYPVIASAGLEVFLRLPCFGFPGVSSVDPSFEGLIDRLIYGAKDFLADYMPVIVRPTSDNGIEFRDQFSGWERFVGLHDVSDLFQEGGHILLRRLDQKFVPSSRFVLAYILAQEIKPVLDMRNERLFWGELQASFTQKCLHKWLHFLFQKPF